MAGSEPYDMDRLGGPPGLFDSPNRDREASGGIVQRVRVPNSPRAEQMFLDGRFQNYSTEDSDSLQDLMSGKTKEQERIEELEDLKQGIPFCKSIAGDQM